MADDKPHKLDHDLIRELAKLLSETGLTEIAVETKGINVRVVRAPPQIVQLGAAHPAPGPTRADAPLAAPGEQAAGHPGTVTSPMVGTAYKAPEPGARPFVDVGETVSAGQPLLVVEAMKTMNQILAPRAGVVTRIMFEDGQPVEYGEPLLVIE